MGNKLDFENRKTHSLPTTPESEPEPTLEEIAEQHDETTPTPAPKPTLTRNARSQPSRLSESVTMNGKDLLNHLESPTTVSKSRTEKFHKLFKSVPENEFPLDYFSCAFMGDILLHGNLYVSNNWFCFYSRIRGRGRLLEIPMEKVISITREKTALIIPNAIGLQTAEEKYSFGSFISRDNTYRYLVGLWKKSQEKGSSDVGTIDRLSKLSNLSYASSSMEQDDMFSADNHSRILEKEPEGAIDDHDNQLHNNNLTNFSHSNSSSKQNSTDHSDLSVCLECGSVDPSDNNETSQLVQKTENTNASKSAQTIHGRAVVHQSVRNVQHERKLRFPYLMQCFDRHKTLDALWNSAVKLQRIPRTSLLLTICTILVMFLLISAVGLTYKILMLEARLESQRLWTYPMQQDFRDKSYSNMLNLKDTAHKSTVSHIKTVVEANIAVLEEINASLQDLKTGTRSNEQSCDRKTCDDVGDMEGP